MLFKLLLKQIILSLFGCGSEVLKMAILSTKVESNDSSIGSYPATKPHSDYRLRIISPGSPTLP